MAFSSKVIRGLAVAMGLSLCGCKDEGAAPYQQARERYEALVREGRPPTDSAFFEVRAELEKVPSSSSRHAAAQSLLTTLDRIRSLPAPEPLARVARPTDEGPVIAAKQRECEQLARTAARDAGELEVNRCRRELHSLEEANHPSAP